MPSRAWRLTDVRMNNVNAARVCVCVCVPSGTFRKCAAHVVQYYLLVVILIFTCAAAAIDDMRVLGAVLVISASDRIAGTYCACMLAMCSRCLS